MLRNQGEVHLSLPGRSIRWVEKPINTMNHKIITELLDQNNPSAIEEFERALFDAFKNIADPSLNAIWDIDHSERRIKTRIPYYDQEIMIAKIDTSIVAASAINFNMSSKLQLESFGFSINKSEPNIVEGLFIFNNHTSLPFVLSFRERLFDYLISKNIGKVYATCGQKRIRGYRLLGFRDIDMKIYHDQKKYLLMITMPGEWRDGK